VSADDPLLLGIDLGTSAVKAVLVDLAGRLQGQGEAPARPDSPEPGWMEVPTRRWWQATIKAVSRAVARLPQAEDRVRGIGLSVAFPALVLLDDDCRSVRPAILYSDQRSEPQARDLAGRFASELFAERTGNRLAPGNCTLTSLRWVMEREPRVFARARAFGFANTYLALELTGNLALDTASAPLTGLFDLRGRQWSEELVETAGVPRELLPPLLEPTEAVGNLTAEAADQLGLRPGVPVAMGSGDTVASTLGAGASSGEVFLTCGFTDSLVSVAQGPEPLAGFVTTGGALAGQWLRIGARSATGAAVTWTAREMLGVDPWELPAMAAEAPPAAHGVLFAPHLAGERTPVWDPRARGIFTGLSLSTGPADIARAVVEGVSFGVRAMLDVLEEQTGVRYGRVLAAGGGTRDPFWRQLRADVSGVGFVYLAMDETAGLGAALLGGLAAGLVTDPLDLARKAQERAGTTLVAPDPERAELYRALAPRHLRLYKTFAPLVHELVE